MIADVINVPVEGIGNSSSEHEIRLTAGAATGASTLFCVGFTIILVLALPPHGQHMASWAQTCHQVSETSIDVTQRFGVQ